VTAAAATAADTTLLINNAGVLTATLLLTGDLPDISAEFDTNFYGTLAMARAFAEPIQRNGGGSILNVLSILSWLTVPIAGAYSSAKAASWSMTNALRLELAPSNIRVCSRPPKRTACARSPTTGPVTAAQVRTMAGLSRRQLRTWPRSRTRSASAGSPCSAIPVAARTRWPAPHCCLSGSSPR
jgi:short-subunit dehydrogenase